MTLWCRVLALLAIITFVVSNQSDKAKNRVLETSLENSLNLDHNHVITKRDAIKDPEKKTRKKKNGRGKKTKVGLKKNQDKSKNIKNAEKRKRNKSRRTK